MRSFSRCVLLSFLSSIPITLFVANVASAAGDRQAQEKSARKACLSGDYATGVSILSDLFVETKSTTYIFNQGRCFEQNRRYEDAIARFQEYLRAGRDNLKDSDKAEAQKHIADCKQMLAQERELAPAKVAPDPVPVPAPVSPPPPLPAKVEPAADTSIAASQPSVEPEPPSNGAGLRVGGIVTAVVGAASLGAGILLNVKANQTVTSMYNTPDGYESKNPDRKTYTTYSWIGYGVGAACLATGTILYLVGNAQGSPSSSTVALAPSVGGGHTGVALTGAF